MSEKRSERNSGWWNCIGKYHNNSSDGPGPTLPYSTQSTPLKPSRLLMTLFVYVHTLRSHGWAVHGGLQSKTQTQKHERES